MFVAVLLGIISVNDSVLCSGVARRVMDQFGIQQSLVDMSGTTSTTVSTNMPISLEIHGVAVSNGDEIRIIQSSASCGGSASSADELTYMGCPGACTQVLSDPSESGGIQIFTVNGENVNCDSNFISCDSAGLTNVSILNATAMRLDFTSDISSSVVVGDLLVIDPSILTCADTSVCGAVSGFWLINGQVNPRLGNKVVSIVSALRIIVEIYLGSWNNFQPQISSAASFNWEVTNRATTRKEVSRLIEGNNLKICHISTNRTLGEVSFKDPRGFKSVFLTPISSISNVVVPAILSVNNLPVSKLDGGSITIVFLNTEYVELFQSDGTSLSSEKLIYPCLSIVVNFLTSPFPAPIACTASVYPTRQALTLSFPQEAEIPNSFQLILQAKFSQNIQKNDNKYLQIIYSQNFSLLNIATYLSRVVIPIQPLPTGGLGNSHFLNPGGFQIISSDLNNGFFSATLSGSPLFQSAILPGSTTLQVVFPNWVSATPFKPTEISCVPTLNTQSTNPSAQCGSSNVASMISSSIVPNGYRNAFSFIINTTTPLFGLTKFTFTFSGISCPPSGITPSRVFATLTKNGGLTPDFIASTGLFLFCNPARGYVVASLGVLPSRVFVESILNVNFTLQLPFLLAGGGKISVGSTINIFAPSAFVIQSAALAGINATCTLNSCIFSLNLFQAVFFASTGHLTLQTPSQPISGLDPDNIWSVQVSVVGSNGLYPITALPEPFIGTVSFSVLSFLPLFSVQTDNRRASQVVATLTGETAIVFSKANVWIWFKTSSEAVSRTEIFLDAPLYISTSDSCTLSDVSQDSYYNTFERLSDSVKTCLWNPAVSSAEIKLRYPLKPSTFYLFMFSVVNPILSNFTGASQWNLTTGKERLNCFEGGSTTMEDRFVEDETFGAFVPLVEFNETVLSGSPFSVRISVPRQVVNVSLSLPACMHWYGSGSSSVSIANSASLEIIYLSDCMMSVPVLFILSKTLEGKISASSVGFPDFAGIDSIAVSADTWNVNLQNIVEIDFFINTPFSNLNITVPSCMDVLEIISGGDALTPGTHMAGEYTVVFRSRNSCLSAIGDSLFHLHVDSMKSGNFNKTGFPILKSMDFFSVESRLRQPRALGETLIKFGLSEDKKSQGFYRMTIFVPSGYSVVGEYCSEGLNWGTESSVFSDFFSADENSVTYIVSSRTDGGFKANAVHSFSVSCIQNSEQSIGKWRLVFDSDQVGEMEPHILWTFLNASIRYSIDSSGSIDQVSNNTVTITFSLTNALAEGNILQLCAPRNFVILSLDSFTEMEFLEIFEPGIDFFMENVASCVSLRFSGTILLSPGLMYEIQLSALNPVSSREESFWTIRSFSSNKQLLDETKMVSPVLYTPFPFFTLTPSSPSNILQGGESLNFSISFTFGLKVDPNTDSLVLAIPSAYSIGAIFIPSSALFTATGQVNNTVEITPKKINEFIAAGSSLDFTLSLTLPFSAPRSNENVLSLYHFCSKTLILEKSSIPGPRIAGRMSQVQVRIWPFSAAGAMTNFFISFIPSSAATSLVVAAISPSGFDFRGIVRNSSFPITSLVGDKVDIRVSMFPGIRVNIVIEGVKLPPTAGDISLSLRSWLDTDSGRVLEDEVSELKESSFEVLTRISVSAISVAGRLSWFPAKFDDSVVHVSIFFNSSSVLSKNTLIVLKLGEASSDFISFPLTNSSTDNFFSFSFTAAPPSGYSTSISALAYQHGKLIATNDEQNISTALQIVPNIKNITLLSSVTHTPPNSSVIVSLSCVSFPASEAILVIAPKGFSFRKNCALQFACVPVYHHASNLSAAKISGGSFPLDILVQTPSIPPVHQGEDNVWYIAATTAADEILAWGEIGGFSVDQMEFTKVVFPSIPSEQTSKRSVPMAIGFKTSAQSALVFLIRVTLPAGFFFDNQLHVSSELPFSGSLLCHKNANDQLLIDLFLNDTLLVSDFAVSFHVFTPAKTPLTRSLSVELLDAQRAVIDASYNLSVPSTVFGIPLLPYSDSTQFARDDQSRIIAELNLTTEQTAAVLRAQITAFREYFVFSLVGPVKVPNVSRIVITFPETIVANIAYAFKDRLTLGVLASSEIASKIEYVNISSDNNSLLVTMIPDWLKNYTADSFYLSVSVVLPENTPLPAFNYYVIAFGNETHTFLKYPFLGHSLTDTPVKTLSLGGNQSALSSFAKRDDIAFTFFPILILFV